LSRAETSNADDIPATRLKKSAKISLIWLVPAIAAAVALWLVFENVKKMGPSITIQFEDGTGIEANQTVVRYRGVQVGAVESVRLAEDTRHVEVRVRLDRSASRLAQPGSIFWIVRPEVGAGGVRGLETIVSGPFIQVEPGNGQSGKQNHFIGAAEAPVIALPGDGTEFILQTSGISSLAPGSPVYYRGIEVGSVHYLELGENSSTVDVHISIEPKFVTLVRTNSVFWNAGGLNVNLHLLGLAGIDVSAENLTSLVIGGIALATPDPPGAPAATGSVFPLHDKLESKWLEWAPSITITNASVSTPVGNAGPPLLHNLNQMQK